jgi:hypothetical protein
MYTHRNVRYEHSSALLMPVVWMEQASWRYRSQVVSRKYLDLEGLQHENTTTNPSGKAVNNCLEITVIM